MQLCCYRHRRSIWQKLYWRIIILLIVIFFVLVILTNESEVTIKVVIIIININGSFKNSLILCTRRSYSNAQCRNIKDKYLILRSTYKFLSHSAPRTSIFLAELLIIVFFHPLYTWLAHVMSLWPRLFMWSGSTKKKDVEKDCLKIYKFKLK